jgi:hypothetical protein
MLRTYSVYYRNNIILSQHGNALDASDALLYWARIYPAHKLTIKSR